MGKNKKRQIARSVYARLWCVYEAFLAFEHEKIILTATRPCCRAKFWAGSAVFLAFSIGLCMGLWLRNLDGPLEYAAPLTEWLLIIFCSGILVSGCVTMPLCRRVAHLVSAGLAGFFAAVLFVPPDLPEALDSTFATMGVVFWCLMGICVLVSEVDQLNRRAIEESELSLQVGYSGSSSCAKCSREDDSVRIWREIGARSSVVDSTIAVLLRAGMSTASLRRASAAGVDVKNAGDADHATVLPPCLNPTNRTNANIHTYIHTYIRTRIHTYTHKYGYIYIYV